MELRHSLTYDGIAQAELALKILSFRLYGEQLNARVCVVSYPLGFVPDWWPNALRERRILLIYEIPSRIEGWV